MKQIVIASGKGGTGKTTLSASFAKLAGHSVMVDADVDAADMFILMKPDKTVEEPFYGNEAARFDPDLCTQCGECVDVCRFGALSFDDNDMPSLDETACEGCSVCSHVCPTGALYMEPCDCGKSFVSETACGTMVHARLGIAAENSGMLVTELRKRAAEIAEEKGEDLIIIDGPPGIGCPVMAAVTGADLIVCIAEPTVSGMHDLTRILDLADHFGIQTKSIMNKIDINPEIAEKVKRDCEARGSEIIAEIPYDSDVVQSIIAAKPLVDYSDGPASQAIKSAWEKVKSIVG